MQIETKLVHDKSQVNIWIHEGHHNLGMGGITAVLLIVYFVNGSRSYIKLMTIVFMIVGILNYQVMSLVILWALIILSYELQIKRSQKKNYDIWKELGKNKSSSLIGVGLITQKVSYLDVTYTYMHNIVFYLGTNVDRGSPNTFDATPMEMQQDNPKGAELWAP